jgi:PST family polysaccharide transporter
MSGVYNRTIAQRVTSGAAWMVSLRFLTRLIGIVSLPILARVLVPTDFGLLAIAWAIISIIGMFGAFGILRALIREQYSSRDLYDTAWTLNSVKGLVFASLIVACAPIAGTFFNDIRLEPVLYVLAGTCLLDGFSNIGVVDFQKKLQFSRLVVFELCSRLSGTIVTIGLAYWWRDYWALVCGAVFGSLAAFVSSYLMHPFRPRPSLAAFDRLFQFSKWAYAHEMFSELSRKIPILLVGNVYSSAMVAHFSVAREIARLASTELQGPVTRALFPGLAKIASDPSKLATAYLDVIGMKLLLFLPLTLGIIVLGPHLVHIVLGEKWLAVIPLLQILSLAGVMEIFRSNNSTFMLVGEWPHLAATMSGLRLLLTAVSVTIGFSYWGLVGVASALVFSSAVMAIISFWLVNSLLKCMRRDIWRRAWRPMLATIALAAATLPLRFRIAVPGDLASMALEVIAIVILGGLIYLAVISTTWLLSRRPSGTETILFQLVRRSSAP